MNAWHLAILAALSAWVAVTFASAAEPSPGSPGAAANAPASQPASAPTVVELKGLKVTLWPPVCLDRREQGPAVCYPRAWQLPDGRVVASIWLGGDNYGCIGDGKQGFAFSADGGGSWGEVQYIDKNSGNVGLVTPSGDFMFLTYALYPLPKGMGGPYYRVAKGSARVEWFKDGVEFAGMTRPDRSYSPKQGITGFVCHGKPIKLKDGTWLATLYGQFADAKQNSLTLHQSTDGLHWALRSIIWDGKDAPMPGMTEGANENALAVLKDGTILCVFRKGRGLGETTSADQGKTWSKPTPATCPGDVEPTLAVLADGMLAVATGRRLDLSFNIDGTGNNWQAVSLLDHHNRLHPADDTKGKGIYSWGTSGYPHVIELDGTHLLYLYDRWVNGSSIWAVRVSVEKS